MLHILPTFLFDFGLDTWSKPSVVIKPISNTLTFNIFVCVCRGVNFLTVLFNVLRGKILTEVMIKSLLRRLSRLDQSYCMHSFSDPLPSCNQARPEEKWLGR